jgi:acyl-CoA synthetase (AMP-forming)/AMP-acid ligase II
MSYQTVDELYDHAATRFSRTQCRFPVDNNAVSLEELAVLSKRYAAGLARRGVKKGDFVGFMFPSSSEFLLTFFAILRLGAIPTALPLPTSEAALQAFGKRLLNIVTDAQMRHVVIHKRFAMMSALAPPSISVLEFSEQLADDEPPPARSHGPDDLAFIQYTSGSTSMPKGVALTHANIIAGLKAIVEGSGLCVSDTVAQWLPLYHDMGLFGMLAALSSGATVHVWPPTSFIRDPGGWLREFSRVRATVYAGPNFSYEYMLDGVSERELAELDLRPWRVAFNGAENINAHSMARFIEYFGRVGFRPETMFPVYGLAEATLAVSFPPQHQPPRVQWVDRDVLANDATARLMDRNDPRARGVVSGGRPVLGHEVRICADDGTPLPGHRVGEIQARGPGVMRGYLNKPEITQQTFQDGWLKTGDMGYVSEGDLFITGRKKELIIVRGENYYPQDIEAALQELPGIYRNRCIAVASGDENRERLSVLAETSVEGTEALAALASSMRSRISTQIGLANVDVHLLKRRSIQRTTSGKYQRLLMARQLRNKELADSLLFSMTEET